MSTFLIGELAARSGLKPQTIRYYERLGNTHRGLYPLPKCDAGMMPGLRNAAMKPING
jgi:hypothetical protein